MPISLLFWTAKTTTDRPKPPETDFPADPAQPDTCGIINLLQQGTPPMSSVSLAPKGSAFVRFAMALAITKGDVSDAFEVAAGRWGPMSPAARVAKAAIGAGQLAGGSWGDELAGDFAAATAEFFQLVAERSIIGRMAGLRRMPLLTRTIAVIGGSTAHWVGEGKPKPVTSMVFGDALLPARKVIAIAITTRELLESADPAAEGVIRNDLLRAVVDALDTAFVDPANAGIADVMPASIVNGLTPSADLESLVADFAGDLSAAVFVMNSATAVSLSSADRPNIGARGGELVGVPVVTSRNVAEGNIVLADPTGIALGEGTAAVRITTQATVEMKDSALTQDATTGTGTTMVSLFQTNAVGIIAERAVNWDVARPGSVSFIAASSG
ncbi:phage major capsid protein [Rhizobium giardinii]|uniref:phage major capsid protein n=1 Tax=Rhizobium giardinii TaxID=56731 RepID=UPI003D6DC5DC